MAISLPFQVGPRTRRVLRYVGYALLAIVTFVFALQLTFPYDRVKDKIIESLSSKYDVTILEVERSIIPGKMYFKSIALRTRPAKSDDPVTVFNIKELEVNVGLLPLIGGTASVDIDATIGDAKNGYGHLAGNISISKSKTAIDLEGSDLPSENLPMREAIGLPTSGKIAFSVDLTLPNEKNKAGKVATNWQKAVGAIGFDCPRGCVFGDGKTKLKPKLKNARSQAFAEGGIDFGKISVDSMMARITIKGGQLELSKFDAKSQDGELHIDFSATLAPEFNDSMVAGCLRFKGSDALQKKEPKTFAALQTTGANLGPDNLFHIRLDGKFKEMKRLAQTCGPALKGANMDNPGGSGTGESSRPSITVQPPDPSLTGSAGSATTPPTPPPPAAPTTDAGTPTTAPNTATPPGPVDEHNPTGGSAAGSGSAGSGSAVFDGTAPPEPQTGTPAAGGEQPTENRR